ncbi:hypothetical protein [Nannocystis sp.]|uniref:serine/threonine protein kinase n=1 Tax=Nannocystis sp. TaxID=1962667 RepID=UPI00242785F5|nr:hypothetical protein [Nannocystis sp.]MBK7823941.1 hypothetical protein [Nannocystis sp.]MBK9754952.1 hypothetical protein [Nannocystis sp.]
MNNATTAAPQLPPGTVIDGTYTTGAVVRSRLGSVTYAATDLSGARVDVTVYAPACFVSPVAMERSLRELRQLEKVHAPQVLQVIDAGKLPQGGIYEVHERFDATSLAEIGRLRPAEVSRLIPEIVAALQAAQKVGVLHRNLGAEAVLRGERGIKLTGFAVGDPQGGVSFGALDCIAPEQVEGKNIDERTLVYNLAALTYRFLRGASLFTGGDSGTQLLQAAASVPPSESMPAPLFAALAKDPKSRPNLLQRFLTDLDAIVRDFPQDEAVPETRDPEPASIASKGGESREVSDTLAALMTDPDAPKLPSSDAKAGPTATAGVPPVSHLPASPLAASPLAASPLAASPPPATPPAAAPERPATTPPRPAIITGPGTLGAPPSIGVRPVPTLAPPPSLGGLPNAPSLGSLPNLGKPAVLGVPTLGKPGAPTLGAPVFGAPLAPPVAPPVASAPSVAPPAVAAPSVTPPAATAGAAATSAKPRTRGWTMFMEVTEDEAGAPAAPGVPQPGAPVTAAPPTTTPAAAAPVAAPLPVVAPAPTPTPAPAPAAPAGEVKPSTRGWTMIMDDPAEAEAASGLSTPAAAAAPPPPSPTTRGWTMLEELNDSLPAAAATPATPVAATASASPATPATPASEANVAGSAPSSRGWTMFMEAELQGGAAKPEEAQPETDPEFYDGPVQTETGTTVAFAPTADNPNASLARTKAPEATPDLGSQEPMTSFGARLRGEPEEAAPSASLSPASVPSASAEIPSFAGNNLGFVAVKPVEPADGRPPAQPDALDQDDAAASGGNTKLIVVGVLVVVAIVVAIILATSK